MRRRKKTPTPLLYGHIIAPQLKNVKDAKANRIIFHIISIKSKFFQGHQNIAPYLFESKYINQYRHIVLFVQHNYILIRYNKINN